MIAIINTGLGNVNSVFNVLKKIGVTSFITSDAYEIKKANKIILPGVGTFDVGMASLIKNNIVSVLEQKVIKEKTPILGICLGMQLFANSSEEGVSKGLGWINASVKKLPLSREQTLKVPNMGWRYLMAHDQNAFVLLKNLSNPKFYFAHSYYLNLQDTKAKVININYGYPFCAAFQKGHIYGVQFHPEKSHRFGMTLLKNFALNG